MEQAKSISQSRDQKDRSSDVRGSFLEAENSSKGLQHSQTVQAVSPNPAASFPRLTVKGVKFKDQSGSDNDKRIEIMSISACVDEEYVPESSSKGVEKNVDINAVAEDPKKEPALNITLEPQPTYAVESGQETTPSENFSLSISEPANDSKDLDPAPPKNGFVGWKCDRKLLSKSPPSSIQRVIEALVSR